VLLDLDYFKRINDRFGHRTGDEALRSLVAVLRRELREVDLVARIGGEEFVILLPDSTGEMAVNVAERLRGAIENTVVSYEDAVVHFTVSAGVTPMLSSDATWESMLHRADDAMYVAKRSGRNRVVLDPQGYDPSPALTDSEPRAAQMPLSMPLPLPFRVEEHRTGS
jgi:diguanylate cyclase (GGDEF)-like protein